MGLYCICSFQTQNVLLPYTLSDSIGAPMSTLPMVQNKASCTKVEIDGGINMQTVYVCISNRD